MAAEWQDLPIKTLIITSKRQWRLTKSSQSTAILLSLDDTVLNDSRHRASLCFASGFFFFVFFKHTEFGLTCISYRALAFIQPQQPFCFLQRGRSVKVGKLAWRTFNATLCSSLGHWMVRWAWKLCKSCATGFKVHDLNTIKHLSLVLDWHVKRHLLYFISSGLMVMEFGHQV